ncbi:MAG: response regulator [Chloroflexota bacterium]
MTHILITDDNSAYRATVIDILTMEGYDIFEASDGQQALAIIQREPVDLVLCDLNMPLLNGLDLLVWLRDQPRYRHIPFILLTGQADAALLKRGEELAVDAYMLKPVDIPALLLRIKQILARPPGDMTPGDEQG